jgi:hypothetical protein
MSQATFKEWDIDTLHSGWLETWASKAGPRTWTTAGWRCMPWVPIASSKILKANYGSVRPKPKCGGSKWKKRDSTASAATASTSVRKNPAQPDRRSTIPNPHPARASAQLGAWWRENAWLHACSSMNRNNRRARKSCTAAGEPRCLPSSDTLRIHSYAASRDESDWCGCKRSFTQRTLTICNSTIK